MLCHCWMYIIMLHENKKIYFHKVRNFCYDLQLLSSEWHLHKIS